MSDNPVTPRDESGDHPPGVSYRVTCMANDGSQVTLANAEVTINYFFRDPKDLAYFVVGQSYAVLASPAGE